MPIEFDHNRLIARKANEILGKAGFMQKGRSRFWYQDHGWWMVGVEFQPSSWSRGTYLNVGASFLWFAKDHFSYDDGGRLAKFGEARDEAEFSEAVAGLANQACKEAEKLHHRFVSVDASCRYLRKRAAKNDNIWTQYHAAVAAGLLGDTASANTEFAKIAAVDPQRDWVRDLQSHCVALTSIVSDPDVFHNRIEDEILRCRQLLKLEPITDFKPGWPNEQSRTPVRSAFGLRWPFS